MYKLIEASKNLPENMWQEFYKLRQDQRPQINFEEVGLDKFKENSFTHYIDYKDPKFVRYLITNNDQKLIGEFYSFLENRKDENLGFVINLRINILQEFHDDQLFLLIFGKVIKHFNNDMLIQLNVDNLLHDSWYKRFNGIVKFKSEQYVLKRENINVNMLNKWIYEITSKNKEFNLKFYDYKDIPDDILKQFVDLWNESENHEPLGDFPFKYQHAFSREKDYIVNQYPNENEIMYCMLLFDDLNSLVALSFCEIIFKNNSTKESPLQVELIQKGLTGVKEKYWGRKFGKLLNAEIYLKIIEDFDFNTIDTVMAPKNKYIIDINKEIGYIKIPNKSKEEYIFNQEDIKSLLK